MKIFRRWNNILRVLNFNHLLMHSKGGKDQQCTHIEYSNILLGYYSQHKVICANIGVFRIIKNILHVMLAYALHVLCWDYDINYMWNNFSFRQQLQLQFHKLLIFAITDTYNNFNVTSWYIKLKLWNDCFCIDINYKSCLYQYIK